MLQYIMITSRLFFGNGTEETPENIKKELTEYFKKKYGLELDDDIQIEIDDIVKTQENPNG